MIHNLLSDKEAPSISCESDQRFPTDPGINTTVAAYQTPFVTDNSGHDIVADCTPTLGAVLPMGTTDVTCDVTDTSGNEATCVFQVHIEGKYHFHIFALLRLNYVKYSNKITNKSSYEFVTVMNTDLFKINGKQRVFPREYWF